MIGLSVGGQRDISSAEANDIAKILAFGSEEAMPKKQSVNPDYAMAAFRGFGDTLYSR